MLALYETWDGGHVTGVLTVYHGYKEQTLSREDGGKG
jgi:hypothetical protein